MKTKLLSLLFLVFAAANSQTITTMAGSAEGYAEGTGAAALFNRPYGIAFDGGGAVVIADQGNYKVRKVFSNNSTSLLAGSNYGNVDATGAAAKFGTVTAVARDGFNNTFVCDAENNSIRKITASGVVTTLAGGTSGTADGIGTNAQFNRPYGLTIDAAGNLYVSDTFNHRIRKVTPAGVVTTLAGSTQGFTNGTGEEAQFTHPFGIAVDAAGNVFVGEGPRIRKITAAGVVTTFAGGNAGFSNGNGTSAQFQNGLNGIAIDNSGNLFITDAFNYRIRKITPSGDVTTYAGLGYSGTTDGDVSVANFSELSGIAIDKANNILYITDYGNNRIRKITPAAPATLPLISGVSATVVQNSATIYYTLTPNNGATTSVVKYGLASDNLTGQVMGFSANGNTPAAGSAPINTLQPNTLYYYQVEATNSAGTVSSSVGSFMTLEVPVPATFPVEYDFENGLNSVSGNMPFASNSGVSFVTDRHGNANGAVNINNTGTTATIVGLPYGSAERSVSLWIKLNSIRPDYNFLYSYGTPGNPEGAFLTPASVIHFAPSNNSALAHGTGNWYHFVFTYNGTTSKIYRNGTLISTFDVTRNTANNSDIFRLGLSEGGAASYFNGAIDDLKIYNIALTDADVASLYANNSLATEDFTLRNKIRLYPNPVRDVLNVEATLNIQSVEIFNTQGQKILASSENQINVTHLKAGIYLVKIKDSNNQVSTNKIVIK